MRKLILVRHSLPEIVPDLPASQWPLSDTGRLRCQWLAEALAAHSPDMVVASTESKAAETARIVASYLGLPSETVVGLHEHDRTNVGLYRSREQFEAAISSFFERPRELVFGGETADQAYRRFSEAVAQLTERHPHHDIAVVTHGTVLALFVSRVAGLEPFPLWRRLGLPSFVVLSLPDLDLLLLVETIEAEAADPAI